MSLLDMPLPGRARGRLISRGWHMVSECRDWVRQAREDGESVESIARRLNVTPQRVYQVLK